MSMSDAPSSLAVRMELLRAGRSQTDVAAWLNLPQSAVSKRMTGRIEWRLTELQTIAQQLAIPVARLIDEPGSPATSSTDSDSAVAS